MQFGLPEVEADRPTFFLPQTVESTDPLDGEGVPFDPDTVPTYDPTTPTRKRVKCAVEFKDAPGKIENFGVMVPAEVVLTLLDEEYAQVAGFSFVVIKGQKYYYDFTEPPVALGSINVYTIHCATGDDG